MELKAPAVAEVESFGDGQAAEARRFRLPLRDRGDLAYVFGEVESEAGIASIEARAGELTNPTRRCLWCRKEFLALYVPVRWYEVDERGRAVDDDDEDWADEMIVYAPSSTLYCPRECNEDGDVIRDCKRAALDAQASDREANRSPTIPVGAGVHQVVCADGITRRIYEGVFPRFVGSVRDPELEEQCMYIHGASPGVRPMGADGSPSLLDAERFAAPGGAAKKTRHTRAWQCMKALDLMRSGGPIDEHGRAYGSSSLDVVVLQRVYGSLPHGLPYHLWGWSPGNGTRAFDPKEVAPLATLTEAVEKWRRRLVAERLKARSSARVSDKVARAHESSAEASEADAAKIRAKLGGEINTETERRRLEAKLRAKLSEVASSRARASIASGGDDGGALAKSVDRATSSREALEHAVRVLSSPARHEGESKAAWKSRTISAGAELRIFLAKVGREAEGMLVKASLAYRAARRSV